MERNCGLHEVALGGSCPFVTVHTEAEHYLLLSQSELSLRTANNHEMEQEVLTASPMFWVIVCQLKAKALGRIWGGGVA